MKRSGDWQVALGMTSLQWLFLKGPSGLTILTCAKFLEAMRLVEVNFNRRPSLQVLS